MERTKSEKCSADVKSCSIVGVTEQPVTINRRITEDHSELWSVEGTVRNPHDHRDPG